MGCTTSGSIGAGDPSSTGGGVKGGFSFSAGGGVGNDEFADELGPHPGEFRRERVQNLENGENALLLTAGLD